MLRCKLTLLRTGLSECCKFDVQMLLTSESGRYLAGCFLK